MRIPIVLSAFGTTSRAISTYEYIHDIIKEHFPEYEIHWSYSSRMVKERLENKNNTIIMSLPEVLEQLKDNGYEWAVVQSLHIICGHEFYRLVNEAQSSQLRTSIGMPLLTSPEDYQRVISALNPGERTSEKSAIVLIGHGTDHPNWCAYAALELQCREIWGEGIYVGSIESETSMDIIVKKVVNSGIKKVHMIPLMLVAGVHFFEDILGDEDSWREAFTQKGIEVSVESYGIGFNSSIINIFTDHIKTALDVIPENTALSQEFQSYHDCSV